MLLAPRLGDPQLVTLREVPSIERKRLFGGSSPALALPALRRNRCSPGGRVRGVVQGVGASTPSAEARRHLKGSTGGRRQSWRETELRRHLGEEVLVARNLVAAKELLARKELALVKEVVAGKELIVGKTVSAHFVRNVAAGESKIEAARLAETTQGPPGDEPEWRRAISGNLARLDLRYSKLARRIGQSFRFPRRLAPTDDVTTIGGRLREGGWIWRDDRRGKRGCIRIGLDESASLGGSITEVQRSVGRLPFLNRVS
jgi:hypothetical protein